MILKLSLLGFGLIFLYGIGVAVCFAGVAPSRRNVVATACFFLFALLLQIVCWRLFGLERTRELYPLIVHLPLITFLTAVLKRPLTVSLSSVFAAYLCCQIPRWIGAVGALFLQTQISYYLVYIPAIALCYFGLRRYVATPVRQVMIQSQKSCLLFGAVPFLYYLFDYATTVYTDWLYSGSVVAAQFVPSVVSMAYFVFVIIYYGEMQREEAVLRERDMMAAQLRQAKVEFDALRQMQEQTRRYRHDMRHHFALLQGLAAEGEVEKIASYLQTAKADLDVFTPTRYCENEIVNLLLSFFEGAAQRAGVAFSAVSNAPASLPIRDTELCSLLSNSLENAVAAASAVPEKEGRTVAAQVRVHRGKLLLSVTNPYVGRVTLREGMPQTERWEHGHGTRSISAIAELHGGQALFSAQEGVFSLKVMIPLQL